MNRNRLGCGLQYRDLRFHKNRSRSSEVHAALVISWFCVTLYRRAIRISNMSKIISIWSACTHIGTNTLRRESICQPVASHALASSSLPSSPLSSPLRVWANVRRAVADAIGYYTYLRRARVQGEWHVHDASLGALRRAAITRGGHAITWSRP